MAKPDKPGLYEKLVAGFAGMMALALLCGSETVWAAGDEFPVTQGKACRFEKVAEGVYYATGGVGSNNVVIVNDRDVVLVDDGTTPAAARAFLEDIKAVREHFKSTRGEHRRHEKPTDAPPVAPPPSPN